jgi:hypothetical protein
MSLRSALHPLEDAETAIKGLEPEIRQYVKVATMMPVFGIL